MTCTVEITLHALSQRSPAESIGKGQKLIEAARPERVEALTKKRKEVCDDFFPLCFYLFRFFLFLSELQLLEFCVDAVGDFLELLF